LDLAKHIPALIWSYFFMKLIFCGGVGGWVSQVFCVHDRCAFCFAHHDLQWVLSPLPSVEEMHRYKQVHEPRCNHTIVQSPAAQDQHRYKLVREPHQHRYKPVREAHQHRYKLVYEPQSVHTVIS